MVRFRVAQLRRSAPPPCKWRLWVDSGTARHPQVLQCGIDCQWRGGRIVEVRDEILLEKTQVVSLIPEPFRLLKELDPRGWTGVGIASGWLLPAPG